MRLDLHNRKTAARRGLTGLTAAASLLVVSGCSAETTAQWKRVGMLPPASDRTGSMLDLWQGSWIASMIIGVFVWGLIFYVMARYRRRHANEIPRQTKYHLPLEILYTLVPFLIIGVLFFFTVRAQNDVLEKVDEPDHTINVVGQKWSWTFNYMEEDGELGEVVHEYGTNNEMPDLYLPLGESVRFNLRSADVIHSFWIPSFYYKLDTIPGRLNSFDVTPTELGEYTGKCAELCGTYHATMVFKVHVVTPEEYQEYLQTLAEDGQTGEITPPESVDTPFDKTKDVAQEAGE